jgi:hypothetical protein
MTMATWPTSTHRSTQPQHATAARNHQHRLSTSCRHRRHVTTTRRRKRPKRRQRLTSLGHGYVFFHIFFLFTNEIFRCYLQQRRPTTIHHHYHHINKSTTTGRHHVNTRQTTAPTFPPPQQRINTRQHQHQGR